MVLVEVKKNLFPHLFLVQQVVELQLLVVQHTTMEQVELHITQERHIRCQHLVLLEVAQVVLLNILDNSQWIWWKHQH